MVRWDSEKRAQDKNMTMNKDLLKDYQEKVLGKLQSHPSYALFLEQGLGKTRIILEEIKDEKPGFVLVICPKSLILTWEHQISLWLPVIYDINEVKKVTDFKRGKFLINLISIDFFSRKKSLLPLEKLVALDDSYVIIDESEMIKNVKSKRTKTLLKLGALCNGRKRILNGTPITQTPFDLFSQMSFLSKKIFEQTSYWAFQNYYGEMEFVHLSPFTGYNELKSYKNLPELMERTKTLSISITKAEANLELPDKIYQMIPVPLSGKQATIYKKVVKESLLEFGSLDIPVLHALTKLTKLHQILSGFTYLVDPESNDRNVILYNNEKIEVLKDLLEFNSSKNILIWCSYIQEIKLVCLELDKKKILYKVVHSDISMEEIDDYTQGKVKVLVLSQQKARRGITLVNTEVVIFFSNTYQVSIRSQAEDRCHRIGLDHTILIYDLVVQGTVDEKLYNYLLYKKEFNATLREWLS